MRVNTRHGVIKAQEKIMKTVKLKFSGAYAKLQDEVKLTGIYGKWRDLGNHKQFRDDSGAILNWSQSTGTISFQGPGLAAAEFEASLFLHATGADEAPNDREIIPPELLGGLTADKLDWEGSTLIDDKGQLWIDLILCRGGVEPKIGGEIKPIIVCGRRAHPIKPSGHLRIVK
jgi:hypothetical protein